MKFDDNQWGRSSTSQQIGATHKITTFGLEGFVYVVRKNLRLQAMGESLPQTQLKSVLCGTGELTIWLISSTLYIKSQ